MAGAVAKVTKTGDLSFEAERADLFARRLTRLEEVSRNLRIFYREYAQIVTAERQQKADIYLNAAAPSHGERQGIATAQTASLTSEALLLKGEIDALEEERSHLRFLIEQDGGA